MTDFSQESALSGYASLVPQGLWEAQEPPAPRPPGAAPQHSAASLAAATQHLLDSMARKRVPRLESLRRQLQGSGAAPDLQLLDAALAELQAETGALDFLAGRSGGERAPEFLRQCGSLAACADRLLAVGGAFAEQHAIQGPVARLLWIELVLESASLQKRVRQGAHWLAQMDKELHARRKSVTAEVSQRALDELARRSRLLHDRLHTVHRLCGHARSVHSLCEQLTQQLGALCTTLQEQVLPAGERLHEALEPLMEAATYRPLVPEELIAAIEARHAQQVSLAQARAEVALLQAGTQELAVQLAGIEAKTQQLA